MSQRIGLSVDDMDSRTLPVLLAHQVEDRQQTIQVGDGGLQRVVSGVVQSIRGLESLVDGSQRAACAIANGQRNMNVVASIRRIVAFETILFAGVFEVVEMCPIMD